ncbi:MAG: MprA protease, GlyGly-CTERM protein-sorting domain-containing form [Algisphaera sp.]
MKYEQTSWVAAALMVFAGTAWGNGIAVPDIAISTEAPASLGSVNFENDALVAYDPDTNAALQVFDLGDQFGIIRNLDAAHILPNGHVVISTQAGDTVAGVAFTESDLVELDPVNGTASLLLDASAVGLVIPSNLPQINGVHVRDNGHILFSIAANPGVTFKGGTYTKADIIEYDPINDTASLFFDGSAITGVNGFDADVRGFAVIDDDHVLLAAFDVATGSAMTLGGVSFTRDDLVLYNFGVPVVRVGSGDAGTSGSATLFMEGLNEFSAPGEIIDAVTQAVVPEPASAVLLLMAGGLARRRRA